MPQIWWWLLVGGIIILFIYLGKRAFEDIEKEEVQISANDKMRQKVNQMRISEAVAWTLMPIGVIIYVYGIIGSSPFLVFLVASCLIVISYIAGTHYRKKRLEHQREPEK